MKTFIGFLLLIFLLTSCGNEGVIFEENLPLKNSVWKNKDMASFEFNVQDTISYFDIFVNLRNTNSYEFSNIYIFVTTNFPNGKRKLDTLNANLADYQGNWIGTGIGDIYDNSYILSHKLAFPLKGDYRIDILQAMRKNDLEGIENIGLKVQKFQP